MQPRELVRVAALHVGVPDPAQTAEFFEEAVDFHRISQGDCEVLTSSGDYGLGAPPSMLTLVEGRGVGVERVVMEYAATADPQRLVDRLERADVEYTRGDDGATLEFLDPDGLQIVCMPRAKPLDVAPPPSAIRPRRLGHVNLKVPNAVRTAAFWQDAMGLALSERVGDLLWFLRAGSEHHNVGIRGRSSEASVHHVAFEVPGWESYRVICDRLADLGYQVEYGPGRHGPGNNLFTYLRDPSSGLRMELYADMVHIDDDGAYEPPVWGVEDRSRTMNRWGPGPPDSFLE